MFLVHKKRGSTPSNENFLIWQEHFCILVLEVSKLTLYIWNEKIVLLFGGREFFGGYKR